jgi:pantetheine-phosphate adenylyltransferase
MASILLATLPSLAPPRFLESVIAYAVSHSSNRLVIVLFSRHFNVNAHSCTVSELQAVSHTRCWDIVQRILTFTYMQATKVAWQANKQLMSIDVLLKGFNEDLDPALGLGMDVCYRVGGGIPDHIFVIPLRLNSESRFHRRTSARIHCSSPPILPPR